MSKVPPVMDPETLSTAFTLLFRQGRSPPSCPAPDDMDLLNRIRDAVPAVSPSVCREALIRVRRLSFDAAEIGAGFHDGQYGEGESARAAALAELEERNAGFSEAEYRTAFSVGLMWAGL
ncbi:hypothetical protein [uncultured Methanoregula sp.]|uniref:hypothetical protein n=1 Tax=uncultured Methanoregula sp. TaxID=1005933 RepID=UPI002AAA69B5|nr:hypothetical protein [uncultured Methanoregula sp.]